jgi:hypothetical protein
MSKSKEIVVAPTDSVTVPESIPLGPLADYLSRDPSKWKVGACIRLRPDGAIMSPITLSVRLVRIFDKHGYRLTRDLIIDSRFGAGWEDVVKRMEQLPAPKKGPA